MSRVGLNCRASDGDRSSVGTARGLQKRRKAPVRKESVDTQEYESCHLNDMGPYMDENTEDMSFIPTAMSNSAGWHEPKFMCDRQCTVLSARSRSFTWPRRSTRRTC